jgi:hypothetical protein
METNHSFMNIKNTHTEHNESPENTTVPKGLDLYSKLLDISITRTIETIDRKKCSQQIEVLYFKAYKY